MNVIFSKSVQGAAIVEEDVFLDNRGVFFEMFNTKNLRYYGINFDVKQANMSKSKEGVFRGMHFQIGSAAQAKAISCVEGMIIDIILDMRKDSPTYLNTEVAMLGSYGLGRRRTFIVPSGCAHGFYAIKDATVLYFCDNEYDPICDRSLNIYDKVFDFVRTNYLEQSHIGKGITEMSQKDREAPPLEAYL